MPWSTPPQIYLTGNTAGTTHLFGPAYTISGGPNITLSGNGQKMVISGGAGGPGGGGAALSAGTQSVSTGTVIFADSNGITFGMSGSSQITATVKTNYLTAQTAFVLSNSNGISWGTNASTVTATVKTDYLTTQTVQPVAVSGSNGSFVYSTATFGNLNGFSFYTSNGSMVGSYTVPSQSTQPAVNALSAGTASISGVTIKFADSNGISWGLNTGANSSVMTATVKTDYLTTARASTDAIGLNTAQTNVTWTANSSGLSINAAGYAGTVTGATNATITVNSAGVSVSAAPHVTLSYWENPILAAPVYNNVGSNTVSLQRVFVPAQLSATRADFILGISGSSSGGLSFRINLGLYTESQSTLNSASTTSRGFTFNSTSAVSYSNCSLSRLWSIALGTWNLTPGEYFIAANLAYTTGLTNTVSLAPLVNTFGIGLMGAETAAAGNFTSYFRTGMYYSGAQSTLPNNIQLSEVTQTGQTAERQPWFGFHGTF